MIKRFLKSLLLPNAAVASTLGTNTVAFKALKDHGLINSDDTMSIAVGAGSRIRRAYINGKLWHLFDKLDKVEFYAEAAELCKKIIDLKLNYPDNIIIGRPVGRRVSSKRVSREEDISDQDAMMMEQLDEILSVDDPAKIPLEMRTRIIEHYLELVTEQPLITEADFRSKIYDKDSLIDNLLDDPEYRTKVIRTVVNSFCDTDKSDKVAEDVLALGLSYKEIMMGGYFISVINKVRQQMRRTNEERGVKDNIIMDNIYNVCIPYSLGITLKEYTVDDLKVKLEETLKIQEEEDV